METVKYRNMWAQILLFIVTFGIYGFYWFYQTAKELKTLSGDQLACPALWTILLFIPFGSFYSHYKYAELFETVASDHLNKWILFVFWYVCPVGVWILVQVEMNRRAKGIAAPALVI